LGGLGRRTKKKTLHWGKEWVQKKSAKGGKETEFDGVQSFTKETVEKTLLGGIKKRPDQESYEKVPSRRVVCLGDHTRREKGVLRPNGGGERKKKRGMSGVKKGKHLLGKTKEPGGGSFA